MFSQALMSTWFTFGNFAVMLCRDENVVVLRVCWRLHIWGTKSLRQVCHSFLRPFFVGLFMFYQISCDYLKPTDFGGVNDEENSSGCYEPQIAIWNILSFHFLRLFFVGPRFPAANRNSPEDASS